MEKISGAIKDSMSRKNDLFRVLKVAILDVDLTAKSAATLDDAVEQLVPAIGIRFMEECAK
jgi:hypothetical protein